MRMIMNEEKENIVEDRDDALSMQFGYGVKEDGKGI